MAALRGTAVLAMSAWPAAFWPARTAQARVIDYAIDQASADIRFHTEVARVRAGGRRLHAVRRAISCYDTDHPEAVSIDVTGAG